MCYIVKLPQKSAMAQMYQCMINKKNIIYIQLLTHCVHNQYIIVNIIYTVVDLKYNAKVCKLKMLK